MIRKLLQRFHHPEPAAEGEYRPRLEARFFHPRFWGTWLGIGLIRLVIKLPRRWRDRIGNWLGDRAWENHPKRREIILINLRWCFPDMLEHEREAMGRRNLRLMMRTFLDYGFLWWAGARTLDRLITIEGEEHIRDALNEGRSVLLLTGHAVALDFGGLAISRRFAVVGLIKTMRNELLEYFLARGRIRFGAHLCLRESGIRGVIKAVKQGHIFYYVPDEDLGGSQRTVFAPFFGVPQATITALGRMSRMANAVVLPTMSYFDADTGCYRVIIDPPLEDFPTGDEQRDAERQNAEIERLVRRAPEQYMWSFRLFQTRPEGEENPYPYG